MLHLKQGRCHRMVTPEEGFIGLWPCSRCIEIVAYKWIDNWWTPFFQSLGGVCASVWEVFMQLIAYWCCWAVACDCGGCHGGGPLAVQQFQNSTGPVCRASSRFTNPVCSVTSKPYTCVCLDTSLQPVHTAACTMDIEWQLSLALFQHKVKTWLI